MLKKTLERDHRQEENKRRQAERERERREEETRLAARKSRQR